MATFVDNLLLKLGVTGTEQVSQAKSKVDGLSVAFGKLVGVTASIYAVANAVTSFVDEAVKIGNVSKATGIAVESLSAWKQALDAAGEDGNAFLGTVSGIAKSVNDMLVSGTGDIRAYLNQLGVDIFDANGKLKDATEILADVADQWGNFSSIEQTMIGQHLGIDEGTIRFMQQEGAEIAALVAEQHELGVVTAEQVNTARALNAAYNGLRTTWRIVSNTLASDLLPVIRWLVGGLNDAATWAVKNKPVLYGFLAGLLPLFAKVGLGWKIAFAPLLKIVAIATLIGAVLYLLYDDFVVWKEGGESAFGSVYAAASSLYQGIKSIFVGLATFLKDFWNDPKKTWNEAIEYFQNRWKGMSLVEIGKDIILSFVNAVKTAWNEYAFPFFEAIDKKFEQWFGISLIKEGTAIIGSLVNGVMAEAKRLDNAIENSVVGPIYRAVKALPSTLFGIAGSALERMAGGFLERAGKVKDAFQNGVIDGLLEIGNAFNPLRIIKDAISAILDYLLGSDVVNYMLAAGENLASNIMDGIKKGLSSLQDYIFEKTGIGSILASAEGVADTAGAALDTITGAAGTAIDKAGAFLSSMFGGGKKEEENSAPPAANGIDSAPVTVQPDYNGGMPRDGIAYQERSAIPDDSPGFFKEVASGIENALLSVVDALTPAVGVLENLVGFFASNSPGSELAVSPVVSIGGSGHYRQTTVNMDVGGVHMHSNASSSRAVGGIIGKSIESQLSTAMSAENGIRG